MEIVVYVETNLADTGNVAIVNVRNHVQAIEDNVVEITIRLWYTKYINVQVLSTGIYSSHFISYTITVT